MKNLNFNNKLFIIIFIFSFLFNFGSYAIKPNQIIINGNEYIDDEIILSILQDIDISNNEDINIITKKLYNTGNFEKVLVEFENNDLIINLYEFNKIKEVKF